ncbi:hypothetical protein T265_05899 [Opisthorchis viverrini]|uniref:Legumain prodomain domain-containing protein n=1 Tax=Opisthorchis viverrini TaxID=6198 RepID=A0A075AER8_OPIVI|nr:hypothetical protein T265_05899 [Opisthorchis viverrini]KER26994.1 hypothetical protein T265_05899 [Opisthorchis viverrini]
MKLQVSLDKMRCCSVLIAFLFCIDHVAWLEAAGVHNWSSIFNNNPSKNWAVLVAGTESWVNYRHQANVYHAYRVLRANKIPAKNIITFAYDDIANNPKNPFKGRVFNDYELEDIYKGVVIDYRGKLHVAELKNILTEMYSNKHYNKLVIYLDACSSGSLFRDLLPPNVGIYAVNSAKENEESWSMFCHNKQIGVCLATEFSYAWITDSEFNDLKKRTLDQQYEEVKKRTKDSHVTRYGEMTIGSLPVGKFQGHYDLFSAIFDTLNSILEQSVPTPLRFIIVQVCPFYLEKWPNVVDRRPSSRVHLFSMSRSLMEATTEEEHETAWRKLHRALQLRHIIKETINDIMMDVKTHHKLTVKHLSKRDELMCLKEVFDQFRAHCFTIHQVPEVAQYTTHLMELCKAGYETKTLIESVHIVCS